MCFPDNNGIQETYILKHHVSKHFVLFIRFLVHGVFTAQGHPGRGRLNVEDGESHSGSRPCGGYPSSSKINSIAVQFRRIFDAKSIWGSKEHPIAWYAVNLEDFLLYLMVRARFPPIY